MRQADALDDAASHADWIGTLGPAAIEAVVDTAPLPGLLFGGGLDIHSVGVFGRRAKQAGHTVARSAELLTDWLDDARCRMDPRNGRLNYRVPNVDMPRRRRLARAIEELGRSGAVLHHPFADQKALYRPYWRFRLATDKPFKRFLRGEWLSCLAAGVVADQARRLRVPVATRTLVELQAAADLGGWRGELDVLSMARVDGEERLLWLECKTGAPRNIHVARLARQRDSLAQVLARSGMGTAALEVVVVVPPATRPSRVEEQAGLWQQLYAEGIILVDTHPLRQWVTHALRRRQDHEE